MQTLPQFLNVTLNYHPVGLIYLFYLVQLEKMTRGFDAMP